MRAGTVRGLFSLVAAGLVAAFMLFGVGRGLGGTLATLGTSVTGYEVVIFVIWCIPVAIYAAFVRSRLVAVSGGIALVVALLVALVALFRDTHSTAGIGVFTLPGLLNFVSAAVVGLDFWWRWRHSQRRY
ncbi:MAG TPA: hypothetical protein VGW38_11395 [Chloroflexota bacterium]|nr:hypothetical protein [Chloroflexota bacterium]